MGGKFLAAHLRGSGVAWRQYNLRFRPQRPISMGKWATGESVSMLYNPSLEGPEDPMFYPGNPRGSGRASRCWLGLLVVLSICILTVNVATRYSDPGPGTPGLRTISRIASHSQESQRQRLIANGLHWISPAPVSRFFQPPRSFVHPVSAIFTAINLDSESWLYNRPPPSC